MKTAFLKQFKQLQELLVEIKKTVVAKKASEKWRTTIEKLEQNFNQLEQQINAEPEPAANTHHEEINLTHWYTDEDIDAIIQARIKDFGGFGFQANKQFLLSGIGNHNDYPEDGENNRYITLLAGAVDTRELSTPITFFFDCEAQPAPNAGSPDHRQDIFDELIPLLIQDNLHIKVLFPYNYTNTHWLLGEIKIHKASNDYNVSFYVHDPYGAGQMDENNYCKLCECFIKKITAINPSAKLIFSNNQSPYKTQRQSTSDDTSCGVIMLEELFQRITGGTLDKIYPYAAGTEELRKKHIVLLRDFYKNNAENPTLKNFLNRNIKKEINNASTPTKLQQALNNLQKKLKQLWDNISTNDMSNTTPANKQKSSSRHEAFLQHDMALVTKMLPIVEQLSHTSTPDDSIDLLVQLGQLAFEIKHDQFDPNCIRNKFSDYSDEKGKSREQRYNASGIPLQGLFYISKCCERYESHINNNVLKAWLLEHHSEFTRLHSKLSTLPTAMSDITELTHIQQLAECANDILHLKIVIDTLESFNASELDLEASTSRYALARVYAILGETAKCLSGTINNHTQLKTFFQKLGKCRDLVKLPFVMPKTATRMATAQEFLNLHGLSVCNFFKKIQKEILNRLEREQLKCIDNYRQWLNEIINEAANEFSIDQIEVKLQQIRTDFKAAKNSEQTAQAASSSATQVEIESDSEDEEETNIQASEEKMQEAMSLIQGYQKLHPLLAQAKKEYAVFGFDSITEEIKQRYTAAELKKWKLLKQKIQQHSKNVAACFEKYSEIYKDLILLYPELPKASPETLIAFDVSSFVFKPKVTVKKPRTPKEKLLVRHTTAVEDIYQILKTINPETSIIMQLAYDQCAAFLGQLFIEIEALHKLVLQEPTFSVWDQDFGQTIQLRHRRLMHNIVHYDSEVVRNFTRESIMPWHENFRAFAFIAKFNAEQITFETVNFDTLPEAERIFFAQLHNQLGLSYTTLQQWTRAEKHLLLAYEFCSKYIHDGVACIMHNIADIYRVKDDWQKTTEWMQRAWKHRQSNLPETHRYYVSTLVHLGMCFNQLKQTQSALDCYTQALDICQRNNLNPSSALSNLANFYADQMDYPKAIAYYDQLLAITPEKNARLYILSSLETTAIECGWHDKAMQYFSEMQMLFQQHRAYFKHKLGKDYLIFEEKKLNHVYILDLMGNYDEALALLNTAPKLSLIHQIMKLRLLRNTKQFKEAKILGESLLAEKKYLAGADIFTTEAIYADVLLNLNHTQEGIFILEKLQAEASSLKQQEGNVMIQVILAPFNILCQYYLANKHYENAKKCIQPVVQLLQGTKLIGLSAEIFIALINFYRAHLLANDTRSIDLHMPTYEPLVVNQLEQPQSHTTYNVIEELIDLLIEHECLDTAKKFLTALINTVSNVPENETYLKKLAALYSHLANSLIKTGRIDEGIDMLYKFLVKYCPETEKNLCSFILAQNLYEHARLDLLCKIVANYQTRWDERLTLDQYPVYVLFKRVSNFSFACCDFSANNKDYNGATLYAQICIRLARKIFALLNEENPAGIEQFKAEIFRQYWRMPMAIADFQKLDGKSYTDISNLFFTLTQTKTSIQISTTNAHYINVLYFGGELDIQKINANMARITLPSRWQSFLAAFIAYMPIIASKKSTDLMILRMNNSTAAADYQGSFFSASASAAAIPPDIKSFKETPRPEGPS